MSDHVDLSTVEDGKLHEALGAPADGNLSDEQVAKLTEADQKTVAEALDVTEE
jgi:hypothetical protein